MFFLLLPSEAAPQISTFSSSKELAPNAPTIQTRCNFLSYTLSSQPFNQLPSSHTVRPSIPHNFQPTFYTALKAYFPIRSSHHCPPSIIPSRWSSSHPSQSNLLSYQSSPHHPTLPLPPNSLSHLNTMHPLPHLHPESNPESLLFPTPEPLPKSHWTYEHPSPISYTTGSAISIRTRFEGPRSCH